MAFVEPAINAPDYLAQMSASRPQVVLGVMLELINSVAYIGIAVLMFPILRRRFESLALGYLAFRIVEFVMQILSGLSPLAILSLSEQLAGAGAAQAPQLQVLGDLLVAQRGWAFQMVSITLSLGALLFYSMLHKTRLIPRFIAIWGLVGASAVLLNTVFDMLLISVPNLGVIMLLNELFLGVWLMVKGFSASANIAESESV
jgi:hypothetical protein